ncbi:LuxR C-terminal-related transcriptional regulator [Paenibacillus sp. FSL W8-0194]|uniref:helix-turn-helix transcriptional regulator n=1 Tax=Paenibacillus sp. FSL W8-0194 TaxID=2921711 RepID=UPI0030DAFB0D
MIDSKRSWKHVSDMESKTFLEANHPFPHVDHRSEAGDRLVEQRESLSLLQEEIRNISDLLSIPYLFIIADPDGNVLDFLGTDSLKCFFERNHIQKGNSVAIQDAGMSAISLSIKLQSLSVVIGTEHSNNLFWELACVCTPIRIKNVVIGYLGLSFHSFHEVTFALPLIERLAKSVQEKLSPKNPLVYKEQVYALFDQYDLTNREKEIAFGWLENKNVPEIADICGISQNTVRTFIKKIYAKTRVHHKGAFLKKFI